MNAALPGPVLPLMSRCIERKDGRLLARIVQSFEVQCADLEPPTSSVKEIAPAGPLPMTLVGNVPRWGRSRRRESCLICVGRPGISVLTYMYLLTFFGSKECVCDKKKYAAWNTIQKMKIK